MQFSNTPVDKKSQVAVSAFNVIIKEDEVRGLYDKLFEGLSHIENVSNAIKDRMFNDYLKTVVVNEFLKHRELDRGKIYKLSIHSKLVHLDMMVSLHDKINEIFY